MLNQEQQGYIDMLRAGYPNIAEGTLREMLTQAGWSAEQVESGVSAYTLPHFPATSTHGSQSGIPEGLQVKEPAASPVAQTSTTPSVSPFAPVASSGSKNMLFVALGAFFFLGAVGAAGYFVMEKFFPSTPDALTNENVLKTISTKLGEITTANYETTIKLNVVPRDADAKPFSLAEEPTPEVLEKYNRDQDRLRDVTQILQELRNANPRGASYVSSPKKSFPVTLVGLAKKTTDPLGVPYVYTRDVDGNGFILTVTMETKEGVDAIAATNSYISGSNNKKVNGMTVTLSQDDYIYFYGELKPSQPKLFGFFGLSEVEGMIPADVSGSLGISGTFDNSKSTPIDARLAVEGEATMGDAAFAFGVEGIKKGEKFYGIVHKMPAFFSAMGQIRGKWISFTQADLEAQGYGSYLSEVVPSDNAKQKELMDKARTQLNILLDIASQDELVIITSGPEEVKEGNKVFHKYQLALAKEKLAPFYEHATKALEQFGDEAILKKDAKTLEYLTGSDFSLVFDYLKANTTFTLLMDEKGFPAKSEIAVRYVPSAAARALKEHQLVLTLAFGMSEINESVKVDEPKESMTLEDLMVEITGKSREQLRTERQSANVALVRGALRNYFTTTGAYPASLEDLKKTRKEVSGVGAKRPASDFTSYMDDMPFMKVVPEDIFAEKPFTYRVVGADYELTYQMEIAPYTKTANPSDYYGYETVNYGDSNSRLRDMEMMAPSYNSKRLLLPKFVAGINTATKDYLSKEAETQKTDSDNDKMTNTLEAIFGTNPNRADTDGDGFDDYDEITTLTNPLGPGKLDVKRGSFY